jgi:hypothetical protein
MEEGRGSGRGFGRGRGRGEGRGRGGGRGFEGRGGDFEGRGGEGRGRGRGGPGRGHESADVRNHTFEGRGGGFEGRGRGGGRGGDFEGRGRGSEGRGRGGEGRGGRGDFEGGRGGRGSEMRPSTHPGRGRGGYERPETGDREERTLVDFIQPIEKSTETRSERFGRQLPKNSSQEVADAYENLSEDYETLFSAYKQAIEDANKHRSRLHRMKSLAEMDINSERLPRTAIAGGSRRRQTGGRHGHDSDEDE